MQKGRVTFTIHALMFWLFFGGADVAFAQEEAGTEPPPPQDLGLEPPPAEDLGLPADAPLSAEFDTAAAPDSAEPPSSDSKTPELRQETDAPARHKHFIDRNREPRPWPGPHIGIRLSAGGGVGLMPLDDASLGGANSGMMPLIAPYLGFEFGYSWRAWGAALHLEGTGLTIPISGQGEMPQRLLLGMNMSFLPSLRWRFLAGLDVMDFVRMTSAATGTIFWSKGFGLRLGSHYRLKDWGPGISPSLFLHLTFHSYPIVEITPVGGPSYESPSSAAVGGGLSSWSTMAFFGLQVDFQL